MDGLNGIKWPFRRSPSPRDRKKILVIIIIIIIFKDSSLSFSVQEQLLRGTNLEKKQLEMVAVLQLPSRHIMLTTYSWH